jgi:hypothetical protein
MATWELEFYYYGNRETWPQHEGPTLVPDPSMYMIQTGRRQHIQIHNEMYEMSQEKHTYRSIRYDQQGHSRRTCTANPNNEGTTEKSHF